MLTRELAIVAYERGRARPDRLTTRKHRHYAQYARQMCEVYRNGTGKIRRALHQQIHQVFAKEPDCPTRRIDAFCKLLDDASEFKRDKSGKHAKLRRDVFQAAAKLHPLVRQQDALFENQEQYAKEKIATNLGQDWHTIDGQLFGDLIELQPLEKFDGFEDPLRLLARYNTAQAQAALYDAVRMSVWATESFKAILRYAKLAHLMHRIERCEGGYRFDFDGPASLLQSTHRYGLAMAKFLPGLLSCRHWRMRAILKPSRFRFEAPFELDWKSGLTSDTQSDKDFDSEVERKFFAQWGDEPRNGWRIQRESEVIHQGQTCFLPDFTFAHDDGRRVHLEIVGFWTPEYLEHKQKVLNQFSEQPVLLAIPSSSAETFLNANCLGLIQYKTVLKVADVVAQLDQLSACPETAAK
jgi:uncharacterized protein